jgi:hypothetical protein
MTILKSLVFLSVFVPLSALCIDEAAEDAKALERFKLKGPVKVGKIRALGDYGSLMISINGSDKSFVSFLLSGEVIESDEEPGFIVDRKTDSIYLGKHPDEGGQAEEKGGEVESLSFGY